MGMNLNKKGYDPISDDSGTGFKRPPKDAACVCDYFAAVMTCEDGGVFLHSEMEELLNDPEKFFAFGGL